MAVATFHEIFTSQNANRYHFTSACRIAPALTSERDVDGALRARECRDSDRQTRIMNRARGHRGIKDNKIMTSS